MCIGREDDKDILSYVDFSRLCIVIKLFPGLSANFLTSGNTFPILFSERSRQWRKMLFLVWTFMWNKCVYPNHANDILKAGPEPSVFPTMG